MTDGARSASPAATIRMAVDEAGRRHVLEEEPAGPGAERLDDGLVGIERRQDQDPGRRSRGSSTIRRVASTPSMTGIRMSITTTSGRRRRTESTATLPSAPRRRPRCPARPRGSSGSPSGPAAGRRRGGRGSASSGPDRRRRGDDGSDRQAWPTRGSPPGTGPASNRPPKTATRSRMPIRPRPDRRPATPMPRSPVPPSSVDLDLERRAAVYRTRTRRVAPRACLSALVRASWMIR